MTWSVATPMCSGAAFDHFEHRVEHARDRAVTAVLAFVEPAQTVKVPEQLVGSVDDMDDHG